MVNYFYFRSCNLEQKSLFKLRRNITIPDTVTYIAPYSFASCTGLTKMYIPNSVTMLGNSAFERCTNLRYVSLGSVATIAESIYGYGVVPSPFIHCQDLTVEIRNGATTFPLALFTTTYNNYPTTDSKWIGTLNGVRVIKLPSSISTLPYEAFKGCNGAAIQIDKPVNSITGSPWGVTDKAITWLQ